MVGRETRKWPRFRARPLKRRAHPQRSQRASALTGIGSARAACRPRPPSIWFPGRPPYLPQRICAKRLFYDRCRLGLQRAPRNLGRSSAKRRRCRLHRGPRQLSACATGRDGSQTLRQSIFWHRRPLVSCRHGRAATFWSQRPGYLTKSALFASFFVEKSE